MDFFITSESSYEIPPPNTLSIEKQLKDYFEQKYYGNQIKELSTIVICVSEKFDFLHPVRKPKLRKESILSFEYKLDFETYKGMTEEERKKYITIEYFNNLKEILVMKKIKDFDSATFLQDLELFFKNEGLL